MAEMLSLKVMLVMCRRQRLVEWDLCSINKGPLFFDGALELTRVHGLLLHLHLLFVGISVHIRILSTTVLLLLL